MKFVHKNHVHYYVISNSYSGHTAQVFEGKDGTPGSELEMNRSQYENFLTIMHNNNWTEQPNF